DHRISQFMSGFEGVASLSQCMRRRNRDPDILGGGYCSRFVHRDLERVKRQIREAYATPRELGLVVSGKKGTRFFRRDNHINTIGCARGKQPGGKLLSRGE